MARRNVDIEVKKLFAIHAMKWCKKNLGINKRKKKTLKLSLRIRFVEEDDKYVNGAYYIDDNKIIIYPLNCESIFEIVSTVIHEYTHYLQSTKKYFEYFKTHYYSTHPYEKQARRNELKHTNKCLRNIKKLIN